MSKVQLRSQNGSVSKTGDEYYCLNRDSVETERLNLQHFLFTRALGGHLIHPSIKLPSGPLAIADFATGTGIWAVETAKTLSPSSHFDGFDISDAQFPAPAQLPANVKLHQHNILHPLPEQYVGKYDLINVRALVLGLANGEWEIAIKNLVHGLKPGGYLQWGDPDISPFGYKAIRQYSSAPYVPRPYITRGIVLLNLWGDFIGRDFSSPQLLGERFAQAGLVDVQHDVLSSDNDPETKKMWTKELVQAKGGIVVRFAETEGSGVDVEEAKEVRDGMMRDVESGEVYLRQDFHWVAGRKRE